MKYRLVAHIYLIKYRIKAYIVVQLKKSEIRYNKDRLLCVTSILWESQKIYINQNKSMISSRG